MGGDCRQYPVGGRSCVRRRSSRPFSALTYQAFVAVCNIVHDLHVIGAVNADDIMCYSVACCVDIDNNSSMPLSPCGGYSGPGPERRGTSVNL